MKISVKVHAQSGRNEVVVKTPGDFVVYTTKAPEKGAANKGVIKLLARHFKVTQKQISILRGGKSNKKFIQIDN